MNFVKLGLLLVLTVSNIVNAEVNKCESIDLNKSMSFIVTAHIEGPRGALEFPALIDTGATHTFIPKNIADGVGFKNHEIAEFLTAGGMKSFKVIEIVKLSFLGIVFKNITVAVIDRKNETFDMSAKINYMKSNLKKVSKPNKELAIIGMSELSKIKFSYDNNSLTVCSK